jgi:hypothetical protein
MGRGRGRQAILAALGTLALAAAGCGPESHPNDPRPPVPVGVTVNVTDSDVEAAPEKVGFSSEESAPLTENNDVKAPSADRKAPLVVSFTISNTTAHETFLEIHGSGGFEKRSGVVVATGNATYKVALPTGHYTLGAADLPGAAPATFEVGPKRVSSQNDLLLP